MKVGLQCVSSAVYKISCRGHRAQLAPLSLVLGAWRDILEEITRHPHHCEQKHGDEHLETAIWMASYIHCYY